MRRILIVLVVLLSTASLRGQDIDNGDFSNFCGLTPTTTIITGQTWHYFDNPCMDNWFRVNGLPRYIGGGITLQTSRNATNIAPTMDGPGSQGIAGHYSFYKNQCYTVKLYLSSVVNYCTASSFHVITTSGLAEGGISSIWSPAISGGVSRLSTPFSTGSFTNVVLSTTFTVTSDGLDQLYIYVDQPDIEDCKTYEKHWGLILTLGRVEIIPCSDGKCDNQLFEVTKSEQIQSGGMFEHSGIRVKSDPVGTVVQVAPFLNTIFKARWTTLNPDFLAEVSDQNYFVVLPTMDCDQIDDPDVCKVPLPPIKAYLAWDAPDIPSGSSVSPGTHLTLSNSTPGGVWSSSNTSIATIDAASGEVSVASDQTGTVTFTYTIGNCSVSFEIEVKRNKPGRQSLTALPIEISPNPTQSTFTITYPCSQSGMLEISVKDVSGRVRHTESVSCSNGGTIQQTVNISDYVPGVYFVEMVMNGERAVKKLIKL